MKRDLQSKIPSPTHVFILVMSFGGATCKVNGWVDDFCCNILGYHRPRGELFTCRILTRAVQRNFKSKRHTSNVRSNTCVRLSFVGQSRLWLKNHVPLREKLLYSPHVSFVILLKGRRNVYAFLL